MKRISASDVERLKKVLSENKKAAEAKQAAENAEAERFLKDTFELISEKKYYEAELNLKYAISKYPENGTLCINLANLYFSTERLPAAERYYYRAIKFSPDNYRAYINLGEIYIQQGKLKAAEKCFEKAIVVDKDKPEAFVSLANIYFFLNNYTAAEKYYLNALRLDAANVDACLNLALIYEEKRELLKAEHIYNKSLKNNPENPVVLSGLANLHYLEKQYNKAIELCEKIKQIKLDHYDTHIILAKVYLALNRLDLCEQSLYVAEELGVSDFRTYRWFGNLYTAKGQFSLAERAFKTALTLAGGNAEIRADYAAMLNLSGRPKDAEKLLKE